jgi:tetratricopeptide (TPR) repeat protein
MWTGSMAMGYSNFQQATDGCSALRLGGFSDWRLPTLPEVKKTLTSRDITPDAPHNTPRPKDSALPKQPDDIFDWAPYTALVLKGNIFVQEELYLWTTTPAGPGEFSVVITGKAINRFSGSPFFRASKPTDKFAHTYLCTRTMDAGQTQIAQEAQVNWPVADMLTLKAYGPWYKAKLSYQAGQFQDAITQAQAALTIKPNFSQAEWAIGISYGRMGQWDEAVKSLEAAEKMDKNNADAKASLKWAKEGQEAAKKGGVPKLPSPVWI